MSSEPSQYQKLLGLDGCVLHGGVADPSRAHSRVVLLLNQELRWIIMSLTSVQWSRHPCSSL